MTPEEIQDLQLAKNLLLDLLATIHRDGGHYTVQNGLDKSVQDANERVVQMIGHHEGNHNYRVFYEELVSKIVGDYGAIATEHGPIIAGQLAAAKAQDAMDALRTVRASLQMKLGRGVDMLDIPEVGGTPEGLARAIERIDINGQTRGRHYERALISSWLSHNPSDVTMELAYAGENPYLWIVHAIHAKRHESEDTFPF